MTDNIRKLCEEAIKVTAKASAAPWHLTFQDPDAFAVIFLDQKCERDITNADLNFVDFSRTALPTIAEAYLSLANTTYQDYAAWKDSTQETAFLLKTIEELKSKLQMATEALKHIANGTWAKGHHQEFAADVLEAIK